MRKLSKKNLTIYIVAGLILATLVLSVIFSDSIMFLFGKVDVLKDFILSAGIFAPLLFIGLQFAQTVVAPIPGQVVAILGGLVFGWWGFFLSMFGSLLGSYLVFVVARRFGRPLAERLFNKKTIQKFDYLTESNSAFLLFLIFLLPFFPDDIVCYLAGLTKAPMRHLMLAALVGRAPGFLVANYTGMGLDSQNIALVAGIGVVTAALLGLGYWQRKWLEAFVKSDNHWEFLKKTFARGKKQKRRK